VFFLFSKHPDRLSKKITLCKRLAASATLSSTVVLMPLQAWSLTLGDMQVQSKLGERLQTQLSLGELTAKEIRSIQEGLAPTATYQPAGIGFNPVVDKLQVSVDASVPSNVVVNLSSAQPMVDTFLDVVLDFQCESARVVRNYTLLLASVAHPSATTIKDIGEPLPLEVVATPERASTAPTAAKPTPPAETLSAAQTVPRSSEPTPEATPKAAAQEPGRLRVKRGETISELAEDHMPPGASLDQMLHAILRLNPSAFVNGNVNRIKTGAILKLPNAQQAQAIGAGEARRWVIEQRKDFNAYRRSLAATAPPR
jgi:pilus assembly protein FimV